MSPRLAAAAAILAAFIVPLPLSAAESPPGPPWPEIVSPDAITLRWYSDTTSEAEARAVANAHCAASGRIAGFAAFEQDGSAELGTYRCQ